MPAVQVLSAGASGTGRGREQAEGGLIYLNSSVCQIKAVSKQIISVSTFVYIINIYKSSLFVKLTG